MKYLKINVSKNNAIYVETSDYKIGLFIWDKSNGKVIEVLVLSSL